MLSLPSLAPRHLKDYDEHCPGTIFDRPDFQPTIEDAYRLQFLVAGLRIQRGEAVAGYKIGCVSEAIQRHLRLDRPVFGHVWAGELYPHGSTLSIDRFACLAIEGELAVRIAGDGRSVAAAFPVIELHNNLFRRAPTSAELIANNAIHAGVVLPESQASGYTAGETIAVYRNGELAGTAPACVFPGGPAEAVERVQRHLRDWNLSLEPGQIVLTGTPLPLYAVTEGDHIEVKSSSGGVAAGWFCTESCSSPTPGNGGNTG